mgnify:CR=1 FL=1
MLSKIMKNNYLLTTYFGLLCYFLFNSFYSLAVSVDHLGKKNGLSNSNVNTIFQDSDGIIWVGTETKINWYLGGQFKELEVKLNDTKVKPLNVARIFEDNDKGIWFFNVVNGIFRLDKQKWIFSKISIKDEINNLTELTGNQIFIDKKGTIWLTTNSGVFTYDTTRQELTPIPLSSQKSDEVLMFNQITYFSDDQIALGTSQGIYLWHAEQRQFITLESDMLKQKEILKISVSKDTSWVLTAKSMYKINNKTYETEEIFTTSPNPKRLFDMFIEKDLSYWVTAKNGVYHMSSDNNLIRYFQPKEFSGYDKNHAEGIQKIDGRLLIAVTGALVTYDYDNDKMELLGSNIKLQNGGAGLIDKLISDTSGNLWAITQKGIARISFNRPTFNVYQFDPKSTFGPNSQLTRAILYDSKSQLWLGSQDKGISRFNSKTKVWDYFTYNKDISDSVSNIHARALLEDKQGNIWAGTEGGGLNLFNQDEQNWQHFKQGKMLDHIFSLQEGNDDNLWIGHGRGIASFSKKTRKFTNYSPVDTNDTSPMVRALSLDNKNNLWVGTHFIKSKELEKYTYARGLYKFNTISHSWKNYHHIPNNPDSLSNDLIFAVNVDSHQDVWVGTWGGGINLLKSDGKSFQHYTTNDGLSSDVIYAIFEDKLGRLWISSAGGLDRMIPCHRKTAAINYQCKPIIKNYDFSAPLSDIEFDSESAFQDEDGTIYFGGFNGVISFNPNIPMESNSHSPQNTFFSQLKIKGEFVTPDLHHGLNRWIGYADKLTLNYDENPFSLSVANNEFTQPEKNQYRYRVDNGYWSSINPKYKDLTFRKLGFGKYKIEIDSSNNEGIWSNNPKALTLTITPPFYYSWIALSLYVFIIIAGIFLYILARQNKHKKRENQLKKEVNLKTVEILKGKNEVEELLKEKQHFIENISHELKTPLTLIFNSLETISNRELTDEISKKINNIKHNGQRLFHLFEQLLSLTNNEKTTTKKSVILLANTCQQVINNLSGVASERQQTILLDCKTNAELIIEDQALETILNNLISNAIKYADNSSIIKVICTIENLNCVIKVTNVGSNIPAKDCESIFKKFYRLEQHQKIEGQGVGLSLSRELVESHQGTLTLDNSQPNLIQFIVSLPIDLIFNLEQALVEDGAGENAKTDYIPNSSGKKLLIVEDNLEINQLLAQLLAPSYKVLSLYNGQEAVEQIEAFQPDIILSDVMMPLMGGFELCEFIRRSDKSYSKIPIILLTAKSDISSQKKGLQVGATDYVNKPFSGEILKLKIANLLDSLTDKRNKITASAAKYLQVNQLNDDTQNTFIQRTNGFLKIHFPDPEFNVKKLSELLAMDERTLRRKSELYLSQKPKDVIREYRLQCAFEMLKSGDSISNIAISCGFTTLPHFSKCFKDKYETTPKQAQGKLLISGDCE